MIVQLASLVTLVYIFVYTVFTCVYRCITQYGSTVYIGIAMGGPAYIRKFQFSLSVSVSICLLRTSRWRTGKNVTACKKWDENIT